MIKIFFSDPPFRIQQKFLLGFWLCALAALPVCAQAVSTAAVKEIAAPERLALFDLSGNTLSQSQSQAMLAALAQICRDEGHFEIAADTALATHFEKQSNFSVLIADSVKAVCQSLNVDYLIAVTFEGVPPVESPPESSAPSAPVWQITLRWLDGGTGQMTKTFAREWMGDVNAPESLPLRPLFRALMESPEVILPADNLLGETPTRDSTTPSLQHRRGRHWLWYFTGAAVLSGGSAVLLLRKSPGNSSRGKTLLPEPPDPPK